MTGRSQARSLLVTGASSGIGLAIARLLLEDGCRVVGVSRRRSPLDGTVGYVQEVLDLADLGDGAALGELAARHQSVEALVLNAGSGGFGSLEEFSYRQIRDGFEINLLSHVLVARAFVPALKRRSGGHLIFVGSEAALRGHSQGSLYCAAKAAIAAFAQALRQEGSRSGLRVSIVHPGMVRSEFFDRLDFEPQPGGDFAMAPEDVAALVLTALAMPVNVVVDEIRATPLKHAVRRRRPAGASDDE